MLVKVEQRSTSGCELVAEVARRFGEVRLRVTGASMLPAIWPGDVLCVRHCTMSDLQPGQILLFHRQKKLVAHRITRIHRDSVITRGDSVHHDDPPLSEGEIVGQVVSVVRRGRPVSERLSLLRRIVACILRCSDYFVRLTLLMAGYGRQSNNEEISWA